MQQACEQRPQRQQPSPQTAQQKKEQSERIEQFIRVCVSGGSKSEWKAELSGDGKLNIKQLKADGSFGGNFLFDKSSAEMLVDGINNQMSSVAATEADKIRDCLKPVRDWMARSYFQ